MRLILSKYKNRVRKKGKDETEKNKVKYVNNIHIGNIELPIVIHSIFQLSFSM